MNEREIVECVSTKLSDKYEKIYIHRRPKASAPLKEKLKRKLGYTPILQPELDMVFKEANSGKLNAVEVKYFPLKETGIRMEFYRGIGQALALHNFGFDHVALWFFISEDLSSEIINRGAGSWFFIRNDLELPLDFSYFKVKSLNGNISFKVMQYTGKSSGNELSDIDDPQFMITWKHANPIRYEKDQKIIRSLLEPWLDGEK